MKRTIALLVWLLAGACSRAPDVALRDAAPSSSMLRDAGAVALDASNGVRLRRDAGAVDAGPPAEFVGTVRGIVKLEKGAKLPLAPAPMMGSVAAGSAAPCPPVDASDQRTVARHAKTGGLTPVHLALTEMRQAPPRAPETHDVYIDACRLRPTMVGVMRGDTVRITNRSESPLLPLLPGDRFMRGMLRGETREFRVDSLGPLVIRCEFASYCGEARIIRVSHPLYAVTDDEGRFRIENVPLDQPLKLHAYHPLFEVDTLAVTLTKGAEEREITVTLTPKKPATTGPSKAGRPHH